MNFIDDQVADYALNHTSVEPELLQRLRQETYATMSAPEMQVGRVEGQFLQLLAKLLGAKEILEIGMFTGYSSLMLAAALPSDGHLITCELSSEAEVVAKRYFSESPHGHKIDIRMGPALETLKNLSHPIDMVFIDADKRNYCNYYDLCFPLLRPGGLIVADNALWSGRVVEPQDERDQAIANFNDKIQADPRVDNVCLTVRDGMMLIYKRQNESSM